LDITGSLESTKLVLGKRVHKYADYFETCRRKRNTIDDTFSNVATETEAKEILIQAAEFHNQVEDWITKNHPTLKK
jgi:PleD family two-component response regulator